MPRHFRGHSNFVCLKTLEMERTGSPENGEETQMSHEKYPGCLGYIGVYTTQLYRDSNKAL